MDATILQSFRKSQFHGDTFQCGKMATLLNSLFFVFKSFLPNYRVKYYDYIVKWCNGVACNWCVSLDIALILALNNLPIKSTKYLMGKGQVKS